MVGLIVFLLAWFLLAYGIVCLMYYLSDGDA